MDLLEPLTKKSLLEKIGVLALRFILPFLLGGITFHLGFGQRQVIISLKADLARLEKKLDTMHATQGPSSLAGMGLPNTVPPKKTK